MTRESQMAMEIALEIRIAIAFAIAIFGPLWESRSWIQEERAKSR